MYICNIYTYVYVCLYVCMSPACVYRRSFYTTDCYNARTSSIINQVNIFTNV